MKIQIYDGENTFSMDVTPDITIQDFRAFLAVECDLEPDAIALAFESRPLDDEQRSLQEYGIGEGDLIVLNRRTVAETASAPAIDWSSVPAPNDTRTSALNVRTTIPDDDDPEVIRHMFLSNPYQLSLLKERNPPLAEALLSGDLTRFSEMLASQRRDVSERNRQRIRVFADPLNPSNQEMIAEEIRAENVRANMESAIEFNPETFGQVIMLYVEVKVNGHPLKAFVDSGAQMTIMSARCAELCNVMRLVDRQFRGIARGVGTQTIIGRVHVAQMQIGNDFLASSFSILQDQPMDLLLGLDMLKRHQCCIDLKKNVLRIGTTGSETPFLAEKDLPLSARGIAPSPTEQEDAAKQASLQEADDLQLAKALEESQQIDEKKIAEVTKSGFPRQAAIDALKECSGDVTRAIAVLFARSLGQR